jgi:hypothetical protein
MAQAYGAAQPIVDLAVNVRDKAQRFLGNSKPTEKRDTSWHDSMVRTANESFRKAAVKPSAKTRPAKRKTAPTRKEKASGR